MLKARPTLQAYAGHRTAVPERIAAWATRRPAAIAVVDREQAVSYAELRHRTDTLANQLRQLGVQPEEPVAVYLERSVDCVVAAVAVLAAGSAYMMLDVRQPAAWTRRLLKDSSARVVVTRPTMWEAIVGAEAVVPLDVTAVQSPLPPDAPPLRSALQDPVAEDALAYVSYTSGSTGMPKGVLVEHFGLANLVDWYLDRYQVGPDDRLTQLARPSFDAFALEVWPCLSGGATLHIVETALLTAPVDLRDWIRRTGITIAFVPTPLAEQLLDLPWPSDDSGRLRDMLVGGDRLSSHPPAALPFRLHNHYGPTECTVVATCCEVSRSGPRHEPPPIGEPISGVTAYVLDERRRPVADGEPGELHLGGVGVARGYLGTLDEQRNRFWTDPFREEPGARIYATGDLVRRSPDGQLHFLGRVDDQIQVRGFRVEPAEVESALLRHPAVGRAVVVTRKCGEAQILAYVVPRGDSVDPATVQRFLKEQLPDYMVPAAIILVDDLPVTERGKLNRRALAELPLHHPVDAEPVEGTVPDGAAAHIERSLAEVWAEVLGVAAIGPHDSFFDIGGDSLRVIRLVSKSRRRGIALRPEDVYAHPVLRDLARVVREQQPPESGNAPDTALPPTGMVPPQ